ncbi:MAG TPA: iron export ABC transporter permease subunit FetB [Tissierellaceae bacterium]
MQLTNKALILSSSLVMISIFFSYWQKLNLEKDIIIGTLRAIIQLFIVGYLLNYIFNLESYIFTTILLILMIYNASITSAKRVPTIKNIKIISFVSIFIGTTVTLFVLLISKAIIYTPNEIIPISGMIISNAMVALSLSFKNLYSNFQSNKKEVETKLSLGANKYQASKNFINDAIRTGMVPTIDSSKTLGIVSLPGMMSGLILAGVNPIEAVKYQILVTFMLIATTSISSFIAIYLAYKSFYNENLQLIDK